MRDIKNLSWVFINIQEVGTYLNSFVEKLAHKFLWKLMSLFPLNLQNVMSLVFLSVSIWIATQTSLAFLEKMPYKLQKSEDAKKN